MEEITLEDRDDLMQLDSWASVGPKIEPRKPRKRKNLRKKAHAKQGRKVKRLFTMGNDRATNSLKAFDPSVWVQKNIISRGEGSFDAYTFAIGSRAKKGVVGFVAAGLRDLRLVPLQTAESQEIKDFLHYESIFDEGGVKHVGLAFHEENSQDAIVTVRLHFFLELIESYAKAEKGKY